MAEISFLTIAFLCLFVSFILSELFLKLRYPRVIGQILTGVLLSLPIFSMFFTDKNILALDFMSDLGVVFLMLLTGLSLNLKKMREAEKDSIIISIFCVIFPFALGLGVMRLMNYSWVEALVVGACLSITAEGTTMEVLFDLKALRTKLGSIMISTGMIDDVFELLFLTTLIVFLQKTGLGFGDVLLRLLAFAIIIYIILKLLPLLLRVIGKDNSDFSIFSLTILVGLIISAIAAQFHLSIVLAALLAGILLNYTEKNSDIHRRTIKQLELVTFALLVPFFFIKIGLSFDIYSFIENLPLVTIIIVVAIAGKLLGSFAAKPFTDLSFRQMHIIGWAMNSRGLVELVIADFAYVNGLISIEIFSALVIMAVITTILFPIAVKFLAKDRRIWYE